MQGVITPLGCTIKLETIKAKLGDQYKTLCDKLTHTYTPKRGRPHVMKTYTIALAADRQYYITIPRAVATQLASKGIIKLTIPQFRQTPNAVVTVRPNNIQSAIMEHFKTVYSMDNVLCGAAHCTLNLMPGQGKTFISMLLIGQLKPARVLYVIPGKNVLEQTKIVAEQYTNYKVITKRKDIRGLPHTIDILVVNTVCKLTYDEAKQYDMAILDEVHEYPTKSKSIVFSRLPLVVLAMSGTTAERTDTMDTVYYQHTGRPLLADTIPGVNYTSIAWDIQCNIILYQGPDKYAANLKHEATGDIFVKYMLDQFMLDTDRRNLIIECAKELIALDRSFYVFAAELEYVRLIAEDLALYGPVTLLTGASATEHEQLSTAKIVVATYSFAGTGVSYPHMTAAIWASPRKAKMRQIIARILRTGYSTEQRIIYDIVDDRTCLRYQLRNRIEKYQSYDAKIEFSRYVSPARALELAQPECT